MPALPGFNDTVIEVTFTGGTVFDPGPVLVGGTFHDGSTPGYWNPLIAGSVVQNGIGGTWQVDLSGEIQQGEDGCRVIVYLRPNTDPADQFEIFNEVMAPGSLMPFSFSGSFADLFSIALPIFKEVFIGHGTTITGTALFEYVFIDTPTPDKGILVSFTDEPYGTPNWTQVDDKAGS